MLNLQTVQSSEQKKSVQTKAVYGNLFSNIFLWEILKQMSDYNEIRDKCFGFSERNYFQEREFGVNN